MTPDAKAMKSVLLAQSIPAHSAGANSAGAVTAAKTHLRIMPWQGQLLSNL
jgi:hypothetical protein